MNNEDSLNSQKAITKPDSDQTDPSPSQDTKSVSLIGRILIVVIAVVALALLIYPRLQQQSQSTAPPLQDAAAPETEPNLTAPEATAQANPDSAEAQFSLGNSYAQTGQWNQAITAYQEAIELDPSYQAAYANLGVVYYQQGQFDRAATQYEKALELDPDDTEVAYNLGVLYLQQALGGGGDIDADRLNQAVDQLESVREANPDLAEVYFSLGVAYTFLNQREEAIQAFETFLARDTGQDPRAGQEAQDYLERLRAE
jgi:tetratricopeptide (TPR) repeat protein